MLGAGCWVLVVVLVLVLVLVRVRVRVRVRVLVLVRVVVWVLVRDAGCGMRDAGCGMRDAGCGMRDAGCGMRDAGSGEPLGECSIETGACFPGRDRRRALLTITPEKSCPIRSALAIVAVDEPIPVRMTGDRSHKCDLNNVLQNQMKRILITGNAGAGKTTLAERVAAILDLPFRSLDRIVWQPGWNKTPAEEKEKEIIALTALESWVIDGVSLTVQERADAVVFLDVSRRLSFLRVIRRNWRYLFRSRPGLPPNCPEILIVPRLCRIIWNFPTKVRERILGRMELHQHSQRQFHLKSQRDVDNFLAMLNELADNGNQEAKQVAGGQAGTSPSLTARSSRPSEVARPLPPL